MAWRKTISDIHVGDSTVSCRRVEYLVPGLRVVRTAEFAAVSGSSLLWEAPYLLSILEGSSCDCCISRINRDKVRVTCFNRQDFSSTARCSAPHSTPVFILIVVSFVVCLLLCL